ncbi:hypothetical protein ABW19_dt0206855 [Dactylella cylindrospora]|nr:hypothetical protein ABW19_dt0206855 [Dactylella cylindrospora]
MSLVHFCLDESYEEAAMPFHRNLHPEQTGLLKPPISWELSTIECFHGVRVGPPVEGRSTPVEWVRNYSIHAKPKAAKRASQALTSIAQDPPKTRPPTPLLIEIDSDGGSDKTLTPPQSPSQRAKQLSNNVTAFLSQLASEPAESSETASTLSSLIQFIYDPEQDDLIAVERSLDADEESESSDSRPTAKSQKSDSDTTSYLYTLSASSFSKMTAYADRMYNRGVGVGSQGSVDFATKEARLKPPRLDFEKKRLEFEKRQLGVKKPKGVKQQNHKEKVTNWLTNIPDSGVEKPKEDEVASKVTHHEVERYLKQTEQKEVRRDRKKESSGKQASQPPTKKLLQQGQVFPRVLDKAIKGQPKGPSSRMIDDTMLMESLLEDDDAGSLGSSQLSWVDVLRKHMV